jgi:hypothetical protein
MFQSSRGRLIVRSIPRAKFVTLESDNHVVLASRPGPGSPARSRPSWRSAVQGANMRA